MPIISRLVSIVLRIAEIGFAAVVAGIIGSYLRDYNAANNWPHSRFIYTEVVAGVSMLLGLLWVLPFAGGFIHWPIDFLISCAWFAAFGLLVNFIHGTDCNSDVFDWNGISPFGDTCSKWKAAEAFSFISALLWLVSVIVGIWFVHRTAPRETAPVRRRRWYHRRI